MLKQLLKHQENEITEYHIYTKLAEISKDKNNKRTLLNIAREEKAHYSFWKNITKREVFPNSFKINKFLFLSKVFGLSFALRLLEQDEKDASAFYESLKGKYPGVSVLKEDEDKHELKLISMLKDNRLDYAGAIVLGLNDALVEFTGTLAGLTFAFTNNLIVGSTGLIMGIAASLSMASSGYLASREEDKKDINPKISAIYTGLSYIVTVLFLIFPYFIQDKPSVALGSMLAITILIIALYTYYISVAKAISFKKRFIEMALISLGVAIISFGIGIIVKHFFNVDV